MEAPVQLETLLLYGPDGGILNPGTELFSIGVCWPRLCMWILRVPAHCSQLHPFVAQSDCCGLSRHTISSAAGYTLLHSCGTWPRLCVAALHSVTPDGYRKSKCLLGFDGG